MTYDALKVSIASALVFAGLLAYSSIAFAANDEEIDTDVTRSEALDIAKRVLGSVRLDVPRLATEEDDQVMWRISYEGVDGKHNEIVINTVTGAYRQVFEDENDGDNPTTSTPADDMSTTMNMRESLDSIITSTRNAAAGAASTTETIQDQIINLLEEIIRLLRTQTSE